MSNQQPIENLLLDQNKIQFIQAGAGAGKTTRLINTCVGFIEQFKAKHNRYPKVILTTFTTKATQEIKERLLKLALEKNDQDLFQYLNKKSMMSIGTIHGVLNLFLNQFSAQAGLSADTQIVNDFKINNFIKKRAHFYLKESTDYHLLLSIYSFKDLVRALKKSYDLSLVHNLKPVSVETLKKVSQEHFNKFNLSLDILIKKAQEANSNSASDALIYAQNLKQALSEKNLQKINQVCENYANLPRQSKNFDLDDVVREILKPKFYKDAHFSFAELEESAPVFDQLNQVFHKLILQINSDVEQFKKKNGYKTISDLENLTYAIAKKDPDLFRAFAKQFDYVMLDEYQDNSPLQVYLLNLLCENKPHFIVGDPQQSIYLFRGARSEVFEQKKIEVEKNYKIISLQTNYRSHARVMSFINHFYKKYKTPFLEMIPKDDNYTERAFADAYFITQNESNEDSLFKAISHQVHKLNSEYKIPYSDITVLFKTNSKILNFSDFSVKYNLPTQVLITKGFAEKSEIIDLLNLLKFLVNPHDDLNFLAVLKMPWFLSTDQDLINLNQLRLKLGPEKYNKKSLWSYFKNLTSNKDVDTLVNYENLYKKWGASAALNHLLKTTIFINSTEYFDSTSQREANIWKFSQILFKAEKRPDFCLSEFLNQNFLEVNEDLQNSDGEAVLLRKPNRVSLMTIHGSKGLQFKHVIITGFNETVTNKSPDNFTFNEETSEFCLKVYNSDVDETYSHLWAQSVCEKTYDREKNENHRTLYVALTRAIDSISLIRKPPPKSNGKSDENSDSANWLSHMQWNKDVFESSLFKVEFIEDAGTFQPLATQPNDSNLQLQPLSFTKTKLIKAGVTSLITAEDLVEIKAISSVTANKEAAENEDDVDSLKKAHDGVVLHKYFESLKYLDNSQPWLNEEDLKVESSIFSDPESTAQELKFLKKKNQAIRWLLTQTDYPLKDLISSFEVEWGFGLKYKGQLIQGQIDAWCKHQNKIIILDYKTGQAKHFEKAFKQMRIYAFCLKKMGLIEPYHSVDIVALYPFEEVSRNQIGAVKHITLTAQEIPEEIEV